MRIGITYGRKHLDVAIRDASLVSVHRPATAATLPDPAAAVRASLEAPHGFPPLRRALTPDDHVAVVIDEHLPHFVELLTAVLEHITEAGVAPGAITLLCPPSASKGSRRWKRDGTKPFFTEEDTKVEVDEQGKT